tara:strand:+ start:168 stop:635 length:468 start_codon:yes stop_codon:yes gene_type:complete
MKLFKFITIVILSFFYIGVGIKHFSDPDFFFPIVPDYIKSVKHGVVYVSGFFEILFGVFLLLPKYRFYAGWGLVLLLIAVFPANYYLYESPLALKEFNDLSGGSFEKNDALIRMFFQIPLIMLAYWYTTKRYKDVYSFFCLTISIPTIIYFIYIL